MCKDDIWITKSHTHLFNKDNNRALASAAPLFVVHFCSKKTYLSQCEFGFNISPTKYVQWQTHGC